VKADELKAQLGSIDLFAGLPKRAVAQLAKAGREVDHADGREVIVEGRGAVGFHLIIAGTARVTSSGSVRRTLGVGDYFGEISVIDGRPRSASVEAVDSLHTFVIDPTVVQSLIDDHPAFAKQLLVLLCTRLREAEKRTG
jgi:CRP/FNR family cyclic AMP-dependent transcriptional regulator